MNALPPDRTLKLTLAYDGTGLVGWQRQPAGTSIQGLVEEAFSRLAGVPVTVIGAGRTDAGVHALGQVASARIATGLDVAVIARALNAMLPPEVRVLRVEDAPDRFHARYLVSRKTYHYRIQTGPIVLPLDRLWCWHVPRRLDVQAMQRAARALEGRHDFAAFQSTGGSVKTTTRTIFRAEWRIGDDDPERQFLVFEIDADGFLRHMVRSIVGTLVETGEGRRDSDSIDRLLSSGERGLAGPTAPALGLILVRVEYRE